jgi:hypothetical protein
MSINYNMEDDLDWKNAEEVDIKPAGWKELRIHFIDSYPFVFWRINGIEKNFRSNSDLVSRRGVADFFSDSLISLKIMVSQSLDDMPEDRMKFYKENIVELFDE